MNKHRNSVPRAVIERGLALVVAMGGYSPLPEPRIRPATAAERRKNGCNFRLEEGSLVGDFRRRDEIEFVYEEMLAPRCKVTDWA